MIKNIIIFFTMIFIFTFSFFVFNFYFSDLNIKKINFNRKSTNEILMKQIKELPKLKNDTNNVIEYNSGYNIIDKNKSKRNFWDLLKTDD
jgi:hypothetical protein